MKLLQLINQLQGFADTIEAPEDAEIKFVDDMESQLVILSIYEGNPGEIWVDLAADEKNQNSFGTLGKLYGGASS